MTHSPLATHPQPARRPAIRTLAALTLSVALWASAFAGIRVGLQDTLLMVRDDWTKS